MLKNNEYCSKNIGFYVAGFISGGLDSSKESGLSYILAELFNMCLKESCFPDLLEGLFDGPYI